jgi:hypothetical protein
MKKVLIVTSFLCFSLGLFLAQDFIWANLLAFVLAD